MKRPYGESLEQKLDRAAIRIPFSGCHIWTLASSGKGYGVTSYEGRMQYLHRLVWSIHNKAAIPDGMQICHRCDVPACVNPDHLFLGTCSDNSRDMVKKGRKRGGFPPDFIHPLKIDPTPSQGENSRSSRLKTKDVLEIVQLYADGVPVKALAERYKIARITAYNIATKRSWKHLWREE